MKKDSNTVYTQQNNIKQKTASPSDSGEHGIPSIVVDSISDMFIENIKLNVTIDLAIKIAEPILIHLYGKKIINQRPWRVKEEEDFIIINGTLDPKKLGGTAQIKIRKSNGQILGYGHGQ